MKVPRFWIADAHKSYDPQASLLLRVEFYPFDPLTEQEKFILSTIRDALDRDSPFVGQHNCCCLIKEETMEPNLQRIIDIVSEMRLAIEDSCLRIRVYCNRDLLKTIAVEWIEVPAQGETCRYLGRPPAEDEARPCEGLDGDVFVLEPVI